MTKLALVAAMVLPTMALADTVTVSAPVNVQANGLYNGDFFAAPPAFDQSLGVMTSETLVLSGSFTPGQEWQAGFGSEPGYYPTTEPVTFIGHVGFSGGVLMALTPETTVAVRTFGQQPGPEYTYTAYGTAEPFIITAGDVYPDVLAWTQVAPIADPPSWSPDQDLLHIQGTMTATYTYTPVDPIPEPRTWALLGFGAFAVMVASWATIFRPTVGDTNDRD